MQTNSKICPNLIKSNMKKWILSFMIVFVVIFCASCKEKTDITEISTNLSCYAIEIDFDYDNMSADCTEKLTFVNTNL